MGEQIAQQLWPSLNLNKNGGQSDKRGVDGYLNGVAVQIKTDVEIARTGNIFHEIYKRNNGTWNSYGQPNRYWRKSQSEADIYLFITIDSAYKVETNDLACAEVGMTLTKISSTAIGFSLPIRLIPNVEIRSHDFSLSL